MSGAWSMLDAFGIDRFTSAPVMIEGQFGMNDETGATSSSASA
jgi:hypothetical protein